MSLTIGTSHPLGAHVMPGGVNFSVFSKRATCVELLLFDTADDTSPRAVHVLDPAVHRTSNYWHAFVADVGHGQLYGYRVHGPDDPADGHRFDGAKLLVDPYARGIAGTGRYDRSKAKAPGDNTASALMSVVVDPDRYAWGEDRPVRHRHPDLVIYEMHVGGFTRSAPDVAPERRGTYLGVVDKIPYLKAFGVTAVELLPVFQFDAQDAPPGLVNYWGYSPINFFAPHTGYATVDDPLVAIDEFRDMVRALHAAGIAVFLDVVFNHTAEGDATGPTLSFRGFENRSYYMLGEDRSTFLDFTGTGNTLNANHSVVRRLIRNSLQYWVDVMHVDGFRFDLASVLSRDTAGTVLAEPPVLYEIESDPMLASTVLIAEAWDASGLYQVGGFLGDRWHEWNGRFRDDLRRFLRGDDDTVRSMQRRMVASPDLYGHRRRDPGASVNFVTSHDGFTLNDLVSYDRKHNRANGEDERDGWNDNLSWNAGVEGPSDDPAIETIRRRLIRSALTLTLLAHGTPMLLMGDEVRRTQGGNNNAYCQDSEVSWMDWALVAHEADLLAFTRRVIALRRALLRHAPRTMLEDLLGHIRAHWHGVRLDTPDLGSDSHAFALTMHRQDGRAAMHLMANAWREDLAFDVPPPPDGMGAWRRVVDAGAEPPEDAVAFDAARSLTDPSCPVAAHAVVVLATRVERHP